MARFMIRGKVALVHFSDAQYGAIGTSTAITAAELATGTNVLRQVANGGECARDLEGFNLEPSTIDVPDLCSSVTGTIPGEITTGSASITYYDDDVSTPIKTFMARGLTGYLLTAPRGTASGAPYKLWPMTVIDNTDALDGGNVAHTYMVTLAIGEPEVGVFA